MAMVAVPLTVVEITNVYPLVRSDPNELPAPADVASESSVFLSSVRRYYYFVLL
jgi:hypothetical protein